MHEIYEGEGGREGLFANHPISINHLPPLSYSKKKQCEIRTHMRVREKKVPTVEQFNSSTMLIKRRKGGREGSKRIKDHGHVRYSDTIFSYHAFIDFILPDRVFLS